MSEPINLFPPGETELPPLPSEQLLLDNLPAVSFDRALVVSPGRSQLAERLYQDHPSADITAWYLDSFHADLVRKSFARQLSSDRLQVVCSADLPETSLQLVAIPVLKRGESELTRDLLQQAYQRLDEEGVLVTAVDNPKDIWLHDQMKAMFDSMHVNRTSTGSIYWGRKRGPLKRVRDFSCEFAFRDQGRLIHAISEPGVFSHRRLDPGARQLLNVADIDSDDVVLDLGCGSGGVALASAFLTTQQVVAIDCNARAVRCVGRGAELNQLNNVLPILNADGELPNEFEFDVVLANPPYFGNDRIAQHFVDTAFRYLTSGGALLVVTKQPTWFETALEENFEDIIPFPSGKYHVVCGRKP